MATLDDKLLGEKLHYYCSSSEDEHDDDDESGGRSGRSEPQPGPDGAAAPIPGTGANTGPKGVIEDWRRFKQLETEKREEQVRLDFFFFCCRIFFFQVTFIQSHFYGTGILGLK